MPLLWKHLLSFYTKIFFLVLLAFAGVGIFLRSKSFVSILTSGATTWQSFLSPFCSLLFLLPLLLGLSSLVASFLTAHRMSSSHEISVLRSYGIRLQEIFAPLLPVTIFLAAINLFLVAELIPYSKHFIRKIYLSYNTMNPLLLLRKKTNPLFANSYIELDLHRDAQTGKNLYFFYFDEQSKRISLLMTSSLQYNKTDLLAEKYSLLHYLPREENGSDALVLSNEKEVLLNPYFLSSFIKRKHSVNSYQLSLKELLQNNSEKGVMKIMKRVSQMITPITFGLLGISFGLVLPRRENGSIQYLYFALLLFFYFFCHFFAKKTLNASLEGIFFLLPHAVLSVVSLYRLHRYQQGCLK